MIFRSIDFNSNTKYREMQPYPTSIYPQFMIIETKKSAWNADFFLSEVLRYKLSTNFLGDSP